MQKQTDKLYPLVPLKGLAVFPHMVVHFDAGREKTISALEIAMSNDQICFMVTQRDAKSDPTCAEDLYEYGVIAKVKQMLTLPGESIRVLAEGLQRARLIKLSDTESHLEAQVELLEPQELEEQRSEAVSRELTRAFDGLNKTHGRVSAELMLAMAEITDISKLVDLIAATVLMNIQDKQQILAEQDVWKRAEFLLGVMNRETQIKKLEVQLQNDVRKAIEKNQKEYFLREQLKVIRTELGEEDSPDAQVEEMLRKLDELKLKPKADEKVRAEIKRFGSMPLSSHESPMLKTWLDWIFALPWNEKTQDSFDIEKARQTLDGDHYGLDKVKDRVLEHLAVAKLRGDTKGAILCLVGPPGVGKTSIASSVAKAVNRNFVRMSLGGVRDESEIRGHRRTYIGAIPGRIISAMKQAGSNNPIILLDEIDKMGSDSRGDPASAMLEVLDSAQNDTFCDHYLEVDFDLSNVMFITTANSLDTVPRPLLDRMEVVEVNSYTADEKLEIAKRHLVQKQLDLHALNPKLLKVTDEALKDIIELYTREAGVRRLERTIAKLCRKTAVQILEGKKRINITSKQLEKFLGTPVYQREKKSVADTIGVATGLAWTSVGGDTLKIEVVLLRGKGNLVLTGKLGDVMKESAQAGFTYIRANAPRWGIDPMFYDKTDIHIHVPAGATPKDGPSAGITMAAAMISALSSVPVKGDVAMTGEITLRGNVMPIGGLKEKSLAALRDGMKKIIIPMENKKDIHDLPKCVQEQLQIVCASDMETVLSHAMGEKLTRFAPMPLGYQSAGDTLQ